MGEPLRSRKGWKLGVRGKCMGSGKIRPAIPRHSSPSIPSPSHLLHPFPLPPPWVYMYIASMVLSWAFGFISLVHLPDISVFHVFILHQIFTYIPRGNETQLSPVFLYNFLFCFLFFILTGQNRSHVFVVILN